MLLKESWVVQKGMSNKMGILDGNNASRDFIIERIQEDELGVTKHDLDQMRKQMRF